jgi:dephospho-CoA kinase
MVGLIGIAGNGIGAGKSTVAEYFIQRGYERRPFAKLLKDAVVALDPIITSTAWGDV